VVEQRITRYGLRIRAGEHFELVNPDSDPRYKELWQDYYELTCRARASASSTPSARCAAAPP
jgi:malate dehydrogenase (oxaloacetate-decarboxylating)(NADP+)